MTIDTTNMCSHLQNKLFEEDGILTVTMPKTEPKQKVTKSIEE